MPRTDGFPRIEKSLRPDFITHDFYTRLVDNRIAIVQRRGITLYLSAVEARFLAHSLLNLADDAEKGGR